MPRKVGERKMNLAEVKDRLYELTDSFFKGATVIWSEQINTNPHYRTSPLNAEV